MRFRKSAALLALPWVLSGADAPPAAPIQPTDDWVMNNTPGTCILTRAYGDGKLVIYGMPGQGIFGLTVEWPKHATLKTAAEAAVTVQMLPSGDQFGKQGHPVRFPGYRMGVRSNVYEQALPRLDTATALAWQSEAGQNIAFALKPPAGISAAFADCFTDLYKAWGVDPAKRSVKGSPGRFFSGMNYPVGAYREGRAGTTSVLIKMDGTGHAESCRILDTSGVPVLDSQSCASAMHIDGMTPHSWDTFRVHWSLGY